ncbi:hypothetical protein TRVL_06142 [Trypanosoma vivax]|nr:hypothetical protein TRVL_06142 [Trypanosoma vivax]
MAVVPANCPTNGSIDMKHLERRCQKYSKEFACITVTSQSTHGFFDKGILGSGFFAHQHGKQCYIDGANLNSMVGYTGPGFGGHDVFRLNLHKTFSIPHGGGGPGMGPIAVRQHLAPVLQNSVFVERVVGSHSFAQVSEAAFGPCPIPTISYMLMSMLGRSGLERCSKYFVPNVNHLKKRLARHCPVAFLGKEDLCAHESITELQPLKKSAINEAKNFPFNGTTYQVQRTRGSWKDMGK